MDCEAVGQDPACQSQEGSEEGQQAANEPEHLVAHTVAVEQVAEHPASACYHPRQATRLLTQCSLPCEDQGLVSVSW